MVKVKICGLTDLETALFAAAAGAAALGFVFAPGRRRAGPEQARLICRALPPFVSRVGVFVDAPLPEVAQMVDYCGLDAVQLHGSEPPDYCRALGERVRVIKAFRVGGAGLPADMGDYPVAAVLLDTLVPGRAGGSGRAFDWRLAQNTGLKTPLILAGGLTPENVARAAALVKPYAVDVSSGVETDGRKDRKKIARLIRAAGEAGSAPLQM
ncbi:phosphoribosylanthranilate isomerase [Desulfotomaculum copahuensis]|uniref:N-(5'-phosphoribosyl)anthranilate isomerase n=1 Tax=Desulfotomaculum copahuensis TaxID=1838280 RepID=A0A1B7LJ00_9FIRM|nr:phosphoribosylanthranilate isomerase [Desulfotomaculum copahuensis]OAT86547.1 N-(5'-phosphoribosyl)anthranilate isomerase [Desulfotomaculum copahuensis]